MSPPATVDPKRHPAALSVAIFEAWQPYRWRGYLLGVVAGLLAGGIVAPIVTTTLVLVVALGGLTLDERVPEFMWTLVFVVTTPTVGVAIFTRWQPDLTRDAAETYLWLAQLGEDNWARTTGLAKVPRDEAGMREFLRTTSPTPANAGERYGLWIALLELDSARAAIAEMPVDTPSAQHEHGSATWLLNFVQGATASTETLDTLAMAIDDPMKRQAAVVENAVHGARAALVTGEDWRLPLASVRSQLGAAPNPIYSRVVSRPAFRRLLISSAVGVAVYWLAMYALS